MGASHKAVGDRATVRIYSSGRQGSFSANGKVCATLRGAMCYEQLPWRIIANRLLPSQPKLRHRACPSLYSILGKEGTIHEEDGTYFR